MDPEEVAPLLEELRSRPFLNGRYDAFQDEPSTWTAIPERAARCLESMRRREHPVAAVIRGIPIDDEAIGATPLDWSDPTFRQRTQHLELLAVAFATSLGEAFAWDRQQDGRVVHDVFPIKEHADQQINSASTMRITWHVEDAFHPHRPDYVMLLCLRNPQRAATTFSLADDWDLPDHVVDELFTPQFRQLPDISHSIDVAETEPRALLFGDRRHPYVCGDPYYLSPVDERLQAVLNQWYSEVERTMRDMVLCPGDLLILDNYRAVHGRAPFEALYDGRDRWLKRLCVSRDLRRSAAAWVQGNRRLLDSTALASTAVVNA
ncbi:TauD/TfdA family dioxygenase [Streptacidiphilus sp. NEAU-YB345]|uniref:TauD/TfdA family dioxygenase n=2 Tax=Streptacidiphilus fuscans TaxID=2789292 RepID=A0A931FDQ9_9ACTN|nr:TauD/TfdA family dioxygenase [Streptacidiphilus fuscans]